MYQKYIKNNNIHFEIVEQVGYIFNFDTEKMYNLNKISTDIWLNIEDRNIEDIINEIFLKYEVDKELLKIDVENTINQFINFKLIYIN